MAEAHPWFR